MLDLARELNGELFLSSFRGQVLKIIIVIVAALAISAVGCGDLKLKS